MYREKLSLEEREMQGGSAELCLLLSIWVSTTLGCIRSSRKLQSKQDLFAEATIVGRVDNAVIDEISGLAQSRRFKDILYVLNDSGGMPRIFALNATSGHLVATLYINGALNCDWEDIAVGPGPYGQNYIYIGDVGGNTRATCNTIYRVVEPLLMRDSTLEIHGELRYSWDAPNCETLLVDQRGDLYLVSKVMPGTTPRLYQIPNFAWRFKKIKLSSVSPVAIDVEAEGPVGGDISQSGQEILIKTYNVMYYWRRSLTTSLAETLMTPPITLPYIVEPQGEAICWAWYDRGYFTVSEGPNQPLYYYKKKTRGIFQKPVIRGHINDPILNEISGLAQSSYYKDVVYVLNDSGDLPRIFAINSTTAELIATFNISNARNCDWEDMAIGIGPNWQNYIYIGDVGGNTGSVCNTIYRVEEPILLQDGVLDIQGELKYTWEELNCETIMVDEEGSLYLVSKVIPGSSPKLYKVPLHMFSSRYKEVTLSAGSAVNLNLKAQGPVAGDISKSGHEIIIKTYNAIFYWQCKDNMDIAEVLQRPPVVLSTYVIEKQGEAVCWNSDDTGFYTVGEGVYQPLYYYMKRTDT